MKYFYFIFFVFIVLVQNCFGQKQVSYIDSLCKDIDAAKSYSKFIHVNSRKGTKITVKLFQIDTLYHKYLKVKTKIENSVSRVFYFYNDELLRIDQTIHKIGRPDAFVRIYFKEYEIIYSADTKVKELDGEYSSKYFEIRAKELLDYVAFTKGK